MHDDDYEQFYSENKHLCTRRNGRYEKAHIDMNLRRTQCTKLYFKDNEQDRP